MKSMNLKSISFQLLVLSATALGSTRALAAEKDLYDFLWLDPDKKVYVLQNKVHKKERTVYANVGLGLGLSSTFQDTTLLHGNVGYYLNEEWAVEALYTSYSNKDNEAFENLKRLNGSIPFMRNIKSNYGIIGKWSPFYGKINTFNKIFYFDWSFGAGIGKLNTASNKATVANPAQANIMSNESYTTIIGKTELTLHATKNIHIGLGLIMNNYKAPGPTSKTGVVPTSKFRNNLDSVLTVGFSF